MNQLSNVEYRQIFMNNSVEAIKSKLENKELKSDILLNVATECLKNLNLECQKTDIPENQYQFKVLSSKFVYLFPDQVLKIPELEGKQPVGDQHAKLEERFKELKKILVAQDKELYLSDLETLYPEINSEGSSDIIPLIVSYLFNYIKEKSDIEPSQTTNIYHLISELAKKEVVNQNFAQIFRLHSLAAESINILRNHPLYNLESAIAEGTSKQCDPSLGANFSDFDTTVVKNGTLHAIKRIIDGQPTFCFDFKISHFARNELKIYMDIINAHLDEFQSALPDEFKKLQIKTDAIQSYLVGEKNTFSRKNTYEPKTEEGTAIEITFDGIGKIILGNNDECGCMYNWIQVEISEKIPDNERLKKMQQMLWLIGLGPVFGQQTKESDERMKIAQLFRAFYPASCTSWDTNKRFYELPIDKLKQEIIAQEPEMAAIFDKYLKQSPELMKKIDIMPGKQIWGISDLGSQIKAKGGWGIFMGVGNRGWTEAKTAVSRILTQGAFSSEQRFIAGWFYPGLSSEDDLNSGGGDQVFTRMVTKNLNPSIKAYTYAGEAQVLFDLESIASRIPYGSPTDEYGVKHSQHSSYDVYQNRLNLMEFAATLEPKEKNQNNEVMVKNCIEPTHVIGIVVQNDSRKKELIDHLVSEGIAKKENDTIYIGTHAAEDFIRVSNEFQEKMWG